MIAVDKKKNLKVLLLLLVIHTPLLIYFLTVDDPKELSINIKIVGITAMAVLVPYVLFRDKIVESDGEWVKDKNNGNLLLTVFFITWLIFAVLFLQ